MEASNRLTIGDIIVNQFDAIFCINLDVRKDRWEYVTSHFQRFGLAGRIERFAGIDLRRDSRFAKLEKIQNGNFSLLGNCGCALSHRSIIEIAKRSGYKSIVVFEDDVELLTENLVWVYDTFVELEQRPWELFYFGATYLYPVEIVSKHLIRLPHGAKATHAIAYHQRVYDHLLNLIPESVEGYLRSDLLGVNAIDRWLCSEYTNCSQVYGANPIMAVQGLQESDIAIKQKHHIRTKQIELFEKRLNEAISANR